MKEVIRLFEERDRERIKSICADTGFLGEPIDPIFNDRELFGEMMINPYLDFEPEHAVVSELDGEVKGYAIAATNPNFSSKMTRHIAKYSAKIIINLLKGKYKDHPRTKEYIKWFFTKGMYEVPKAPKGIPHVHINIHHNHRGNPLVGIRMLHRLENILREEGEEKYYGRVFVSDRRTLRSYIRHGFQEYDRKKLTSFEREMGEAEIYKVTIVKSLLIDSHK